MAKDQKAELRRILRRLAEAAKKLDLVILATPSGETRNLLTEANIHLTMAIENIEWSLKR